MNREEAKKLLAEVQENMRRLDECEGPHDFQPLPSDRPISRDYECTKCRGVVPSIHRFWYEKGLQHGTASCDESSNLTPTTAPATSATPEPESGETTSSDDKASPPSITGPSNSF